MFNEIANRSYEKVGFRVERVLKENIYYKRHYHDEVVIAISKERRIYPHNRFTKNLDEN